MKLDAGKVFSIAKENCPLRGYTVSKEIEGGSNPIIVFSPEDKTVRPFRSSLFFSSSLP